MSDGLALTDVPADVIMHTPIRNRCKCLTCGDVVESAGPLAACSCSATMADGGPSLYRRAWTRGSPKPFRDVNDFEGVNPYRVVLDARKTA
jgi:hypothetical protein